MVTDEFANLAANQTFRLLVSADESGKRSVIDGTPVTTDATGAGSTPPGSATYASLPVRRGLYLYRDINANQRLDTGVDETIYRGNATVTSCPQSVTVSPK